MDLFHKIFGKKNPKSLEGSSLSDDDNGSSSKMNVSAARINKRLEDAQLANNPPGTSKKETGNLRPNEEEMINEFEKRFEFQFHDKKLIATALKHRSYLNMTNEPRKHSNERLEFLGDAVLDLVVTHFLYKRFPDKPEGHLSKVKSILVSKPVMADIGARISLGDLVLMNRGEEKTGGRKRKSILADVFEAIIGAIYLDKGLEEAEKFIYTYLLNDLKQIIRQSLYRNYKSILLEYAQSNGNCLPEYRIVKEMGPDHAKEFMVEVWINQKKLGEGQGRSKKIAEQEAAKRAVKALDIKANG